MFSLSPLPCLVVGEGAGVCELVGDVVGGAGEVVWDVGVVTVGGDGVVVGGASH